MKTLETISVVALLLLSLVLVSGPTYCGWRVLDRRAEKARLGATDADQIIGLATMLLGIYGFSWLPYCFGALLHERLLGHVHVFSTPRLLTILCAMVPALVSAGVIACGARLCAVVRWMPRVCRGWTNFSDSDGWQRFFGGCALLTGVFGVGLAFICCTCYVPLLFR